eukprot:3183469-Prymnesium_polylepis.1
MSQSASVASATPPAARCTSTASYCRRALTHGSAPVCFRSGDAAHRSIGEATGMQAPAHRG